GLFDADEETRLVLHPERKAYVFLIRGGLNVNGLALAAGDAVMLAQESELHLSRGKDAEVLVFDLAP
ncbi:MAG: quercetin 2,3-dioxygenase, partial [Betaproteobacteria bacterium]